MHKNVSDCLKFFEEFPEKLKSVQEVLGEISEADKLGKALLKGLLVESYQLFLEAIDTMAKALPFVVTSENYSAIEELNVKLKKFLEENRDRLVVWAEINVNEIKKDEEFIDGILKLKSKR